MAGPHPSVAAVRVAVRQALSDLPAGAHVLVAGSGGADSTALAAATAFVAPRLNLSAGFACADQHWSPDSAKQAAAAVDGAKSLGLEPSIVLDAPAERTEGAARDARRSALQHAARDQGAAAILLGHTLEDQAETVLLRLARGSGARSLSGMAAVDGLWRRPLLGLHRDLVRESCRVAGLLTWQDPSNSDPAFARARVRAAVLPLLEEQLGPGIADSLARSAALLRADADALETLAGRYLDAFDTLAAALSIEALQTLLPAIRTRVLRTAALGAGCPPTDVSAAHVASLEALVTGWRGQGPVSLPGGVAAERQGGTIILTHTGTHGRTSESEARQMRQ